MVVYASNSRTRKAKHFDASLCIKTPLKKPKATDEVTKMPGSTGKDILSKCMLKHNDNHIHSLGCLIKGEPFTPQNTIFVHYWWEYKFPLA